MIFPKDFESKTGFVHLRQILVDKCETRLGKEEALSMKFSSVFDDIRRKLICVSEMSSLIHSGTEMPEERVYDVVPWLAETKAAGSFMSSERLQKLSATLQTMTAVGAFSQERMTKEPAGSLI